MRESRIGPCTSLAADPHAARAFEIARALDPVSAAAAVRLLDAISVSCLRVWAMRTNCPIALRPAAAALAASRAVYAIPDRSRQLAVSTLECLARGDFNSAARFATWARQEWLHDRADEEGDR